MAAEFCPSCGNPLPANAQFCPKCGGALPAGASASSLGLPPPIGMGAPPSSGSGAGGPPDRPLAELLGVQSTREFLLQHLLIGPKHSYRVMSKAKTHLFSVGENVHEERQALWNSFVHPAQPGEPRVQFHWGAGAVRPVMSYWGLEDFAGNLRGTLTLGAHRAGGTATLANAAGEAVLTVEVTRGVASITATATTADGRPVLEVRSKMLHRNFPITDPTGGEVANIHEPLASVRDTLALELKGNADPVHVTVLAILVDHFWGK